MDINGLYNSIVSSIAKINEKTINAYNFSNTNSFNNILTKISIGSQQSSNQQLRNNLNSNDAVSNEDIKNTQGYQGDNNVNKNNTNVANNTINNSEDSTPVTKQMKNSLKEAGVSENDLNSIKNLKDLKEYLSKNVLSENSKDILDINSLLDMLSVLMNNSFSKNDILNLKEKISSDIETTLNNALQSISAGGKLTKENLSQVINSIKETVKDTIKTDLQNIQGKISNPNLPDDLADKLLDKIKQQIVSDVSSKPKGTVNDDILSKIQKELIVALNEGFNDLKSKQNNSNDIINNLKAEVKNLNVKESVVFAADKKNSQNSPDDSQLDNKDSKTGDNFLKNLLSDNSNDKISKVTNFMSQFNNIRLDNNAISSIDNIVINKSNLSDDMIKAFRYMQSNNMKDLTVKINPKELGEVVINLTMEEDGVMKATVTASNKETYNLLNSNLTDITNKLQNSDIKIENLSLNIYNEDTTFFKDGSGSQGNNEEQKGRKSSGISGVSEENEELDSLSQINSNVNTLA